MIRDLRRRHYQHLCLFLTSAGFLVWFANLPLIFVFSCVLCYVAWFLYQQHRLIEWLTSGARTVPPPAVGLWGSIFDHLYHMRREQRKQLKGYRDVVQRIRSSTQALNDGVILLDSAGNLQWWNSTARKFLRLQKADVGQPLTNLLREPSFIQFYNTTRDREPVTLANPGQPDQYLQVEMTVFGKGERLLLLRDVSRLHRLEQMRQDFVSNASHELKTPLTVLKGHLENMLLYPDNFSPAKSRAISSMRQQTTRMTNLVNDLLMLTRLDSDADASDHHQEINVPQFLAQAAQDARELSAEKQHRIELACQTNLYLSGNIKLLRSAVNNLVFNAVNYSAAGTLITIEWKKLSSGAVISVRDQGIGIEDAHIPRLTERFYRVDAGRSSEQGGTGLGLAIVKHALQKHGAKLTIQSEKNIGSTFNCIFPEERLITPALLLKGQR